MKAALEGFASISEIRVELDRDDIVLRYNTSEIGIDEILEACNASGFPATVVTGPPAEPEKAATEEIEGEDPDFFLAALATAKEERKPIVLDFSAKWCAPCQQMLRVTFPDPRVVGLLEEFVFLRIDTDDYPGLSNKFGVVGMPDVRILSPDGKEVRQLLGFHDAESFAKELRASLRAMEEAGTPRPE